MLNDNTLTTEPEQIYNQVNDHFKYVAGPRNTRDIPDEWIPDYTPLHEIDERWFDSKPKISRLMN